MAFYGSLGYVVYNKDQLFGSGIELGIGIDTQPDTDIITMASITISMAILRPFLNFEDSPINLYYMAQNKGFCQGFPAMS